MAKDRTGYVGKDKNGKWFARVTVTDNNGKRRNVAKRAQDKRDAKSVLKSILRSLEAEGSQSVDLAKLTFHDLADYYALHYCKPAEYIDGKKVTGLRDVESAKWFLVCFRNYFGSRRLREITYKNIADYNAMRLRIPTRHKRQRTIASMNRELGVLKRIFGISVRQGWIARNPFDAGEPLISPSSERQREQILSLEDEQRLLAVCESSESKHLRPLVICLLDTGARKSELAKHLRWRSVCFVSRSITIEGMTTKTLKARKVSMTRRVFESLSTLYEESSKEPDARVFDTSRTVHRAFAKACQKAGIGYGSPHGITLHSLRHTAATRLVKGNMSIQMVGRILGHSQPQTTYRYLSVDVETTEQAAAILDTFQNRCIPQDTD